MSKSSYISAISRLDISAIYLGCISRLYISAVSHREQEQPEGLVDPHPEPVRVLDLEVAVLSRETKLRVTR